MLFVCTGEDAIRVAGLKLLRSEMVRERRDCVLGLDLVASLLITRFDLICVCMKHDLCLVWRSICSSRIGVMNTVVLKALARAIASLCAGQANLCAADGPQAERFQTRPN